MNDVAPKSPLVYGLGIAISIAHLYANTLGAFSELWTSALHFGALGLLAAALVSDRRDDQSNESASPLWLFANLSLGVAALASGVYLVLAEESLYARGQAYIWSDWVFSLCAILTALELCRRTSGWVIPILALTAISYVGVWGQFLDNVFHFPGLNWETILYRSYFSSEGMFGPIAQISSTYVFMFVLLGAFLVRSGAGEFIIKLALLLVGRFTGGPALVAVFSSSLMGSISGSAVANTVSTGVITIPMMKKAGFSPRFAAAVEAAASTGGQLMPPVMGAGAFIMANYTQISYLHIISVAALPALLYFFSIVFYVRAEARRLSLSYDTGDLPSLKDTVRQGGHSVLPIVVLIACLVAGFTPTYSAGIAIVSVVVFSWPSPTKMGWRELGDALFLGARNMTTMAMLLIAVGLVVNVINTTGIGNTFSLMINDWANNSLLLTIVLVALASLILGMGLPVTAAYVVLVTLTAPALYQLLIHEHLIAALTQQTLPDMVKATLMLLQPGLDTSQPLSVSQASLVLSELPSDMRALLEEQMLDAAVLTGALLSAHMIVFWLSQDSNVTPPVCLTVFAAAAIAQARPMQTGFTAWKIAKGLYVIPLLFAFTPFLYGEITTQLYVFFMALLGLYALVGALQGYLEGFITPWQRGAAALLGVALIWPTALEVSLVAFVSLAALTFFTRERNT